MIKIKTLNNDGKLRLCAGNILITNSEGSEINGVTGVNINLTPNDVIRANLSVMVDSMEIFAKETIVYVDKDGNKYKRIDE